MLMTCSFSALLAPAAIEDKDMDLCQPDLGVTTSLCHKGSPEVDGQ